MAGVSEKPIEIPAGVELRLSNRDLHVKGPNGELAMALHENIECVQAEGSVAFRARTEKGKALIGTTRSLAVNMMAGVSTGFEKRLELQGVGYRAQLRGKALNLQLGYSHPITYNLPEGVKAEMPSQTEIVLKGADKQKVGQAASEIRGFRPPEPYKGKGVRYADERIVRKEGKKK